MAKTVKKQLRGKTADQRQRYLRGYWLVAVHQNPAFKPFKDVFDEEIAR